MVTAGYHSMQASHGAAAVAAGLHLQLLARIAAG